MMATRNAWPLRDLRREVPRLCSAVWLAACYPQSVNLSSIANILPPLLGRGLTVFPAGDGCWKPKLQRHFSPSQSFPGEMGYCKEPEAHQIRSPRLVRILVGTCPCHSLGQMPTLGSVSYMNGITSTSQTNQSDGY